MTTSDATPAGAGQQQVRTFNVSTSKPIRVKEYPDVWIYVSPFIFFLGIAGNVLTVLVMKRRRLRRSTTAVYLVALAVADSLALVTRIPTEFFEAVRVGSFRNLNRWSCRFEKFLFYTFSDIAIWILVLFTIDRFIAVCMPFYKAKVCLPKRALAACGAASVLLIGKNFHVFWTRGEEYDRHGNVQAKCGRPAFYFEHYVRPWIALTTITLMPFLIIAGCNISIVVHLIKARHKVAFHQISGLGRADSSSFFQRSFRSSTGNCNSKSATSTFGFIPWTSQKIRGPAKVFTQTTLMCLSTSVAFLVCVSPSIILTLGRIVWSKDPKSVYVFGVAQAINYQLSCLNHAINFFLYCLSGQRFRRELWDMLTGHKDGSFRRRAGKGAELQKASASNSLSDSNKQDATRASANMLATIQEMSPPIGEPGQTDPGCAPNEHMLVN